jgi:hypothetical protein
MYSVALGVGDKPHWLLKVFQYFTKCCRPATDFSLKTVAAVFTEMLKERQQSP